MSVLGKKWVIKNPNSQKDTIEKLLENRKDIDIHGEDFFNDPFLFTDMEKGITRVKEAIEKQEKIIVFGDYDVDGITGAAILVQALRSVNANVSFRLPNREKDGYGLTDKFIDEFIEKGVNLIITVDCGISCADQVKRANENKIDTIITDHHTIPENIPEAVAVIHPKLDSQYPYKELTGAGVALKFAQALIPSNQELLDSLIELASLGTVADLGPLTGENRVIVKQGLKSLPQTKSSGLQKLMELASINTKTRFNTGIVGFQIAPRINAAGRIGDPYKALFLLLQDDLERVEVLGKELEELNEKRRTLTSQAINEVKEAISSYNGQMPQVIIEYNSKWHVGIIGLVAGKLTEQYFRPAIIMTQVGDIFVGSARSVKGFNIVEALTSCREHLTSYGGHYMAAGFSLEARDLENFKRAMGNYAKANSENIETTPTIEIDCELDENEIGSKLLEKIDELSPFGIGNQKPKFLLKGISPQFINKVGNDGAHLKFEINIGDSKIGVIGFRMGDFADEMRKHRSIDLVATIERNQWREREYIQLNAIDFKEA